ncbi:response regulator [Pelosinus propionicus]|uniref:Two-component system, response regulator YesN n=1 Tax=Pelosinus propionicus DSM 13327 TaxID=1123291 RepID=A0A1I4JVW1_9FIRM|nr:response regulator [Pelosinus propionicus]SFL70690.1 two-component system, response regulator YesN [Pelosinus propionicus DSM 13327]
MHRILIIDDDRIIRKGLAKTIPWEKYGFQLGGEAADGEQGLKLIDEWHPHIVISDIRMPFMDGLDMARIVKERYPMIKLILLTGYNDFTYAQQAIKIKAFDYLLKPVDKELLLEKVKNAAVEWDEEHTAQQKIREAKPFLRKALLTKIIECQQKEEEEELLQNAMSLGIQLTGNTFIVFLIKVDEYYKEAMKMAEYSELKKALKYCVFNICEELVYTRRKGGVVELEQDELILLYSSDETLNEAEQNARNFAEEIQNTVKAYLKTTATIAIGGVHQGISCIRFSYQEARSLLRFRHVIGKDKVYSLADIGFSPTNDHNIQIEGKAYELVNHIKLGLLNDALGVINDLEYVMMQQKYISLYHVRLFSVQIIISLFSGAAEWAREWEKTQQANVTIIYNRINEMQTIKEIMDLIRTIVCELVEFMTNQRENHRYGIIGEAAKYIEEHYNKQGLSLQEVAKHVHINPVYLSALFKQEKRITFSEFLLHIRMKKAMELLRLNDMKTYEVAEEVGYSSPEYFSVCFKKYTGVPPLEFKNKI